jgi:hypothetical protein
MQLNSGKMGLETECLMCHGNSCPDVLWLFAAPPSCWTNEQEKSRLTAETLYLGTDTLVVGCQKPCVRHKCIPAKHRVCLLIVDNTGVDKDDVKVNCFELVKEQTDGNNSILDRTMCLCMYRLLLYKQS